MQHINEEQEPMIAIIGLGYVGLPLAVEFARHFRVLGFDINEARVQEINNGKDATLEVSENDLAAVLSQELGSKGLRCANDVKELEPCNVYIVTVPTPIDQHTNPDLTPLVKASETIGKFIKKKDVVIYESTVYPGATEEVCAPILESTSGLKFNVDFYCGYSPERINPGDKLHTVSKILKVTSGSTPEAARFVDALYKRVIKAGTFLASSMKIAEAAKVIENSQRDINIAFVNELSIIFGKLGIDTADVLEAAGTKWNFLPFRPGLVGGHCIGVDPYYLAQKAKSVGYYPQMILSGRRLNNGMGSFIAKKMIKLLINNDKNIKGSSVLILGITFKENCPDIRNSRVIDVIRELRDYHVEVDIYDPWADENEVEEEFGIRLLEDAPTSINYDGILLAVSHNEFLSLVEGWELQGAVLFDVKSFLPREKVTARL